jgi:hypothetical protein
MGLGNISEYSLARVSSFEFELTEPLIQVGAPLAGMLSDRAVIKWRKRRGGVWVPEDRLRATLLGAATFVPLSIVFCGLITHFIPGPLGLALNLFCFFFNGLGVDLVLSPSSAYNVDVMHSQSSQMLAASVCVLCFPLSPSPSSLIRTYVNKQRTTVLATVDRDLGNCALNKPLWRADHQHGCGHHRVGRIHVWRWFSITRNQ